MSIGEVAGPTAAIGLRLYYKPLVPLIWLGALVMALGGALSLTDRRLRIGSPARRARPRPARLRRRSRAMRFVCSPWRSLLLVLGARRPSPCSPTRS